MNILVWTENKYTRDWNSKEFSGLFYFWLFLFNFSFFNKIPHPYSPDPAVLPLHWNCLCKKYCSFTFPHSNEHFQSLSSFSSIWNHRLISWNYLFAWGPCHYTFLYLLLANQSLLVSFSPSASSLYNGDLGITHN